MVSVWSTFQLTGVNVMVVGAAEASEASEPVTVKVTSSVGFESSTRVTEPSVPASDTVIELPDRVMPAVSTLRTSTSACRTSA